MNRQIDGKEVPPLNFRQLEQYTDVLIEFSDITDPLVALKSLSKIVPVVHAAMKRVYPDITIDEVKDFITMENFRSVFEAVMGVAASDVKAVAPGGSSPAAMAAS